jgi:abequosyltransferase
LLGARRAPVRADENGAEGRLPAASLAGTSAEETISFRQSGIVDRYRLAIEGYQRIVDHFFGRDSVEAFHVRRVLRNEFDLKMFLNAKLIASEDPSGRQRELLERLFSGVYCDGSLRTRANG